MLAGPFPDFLRAFHVRRRVKFIERNREDGEQKNNAYLAALHAWLAAKAATGLVPADFQSALAFSNWCEARIASPRMRGAATRLYREFQKWRRGRPAKKRSK